MQNFSGENEFFCMRINNHFHINGFALSLVLKQRPGATGNGLLDDDDGDDDDCYHT